MWAVVLMDKDYMIMWAMLKAVLKKNTVPSRIMKTKSIIKLMEAIENDTTNASHMHLRKTSISKTP